jgi:CRP/FNR family cyclic AMP-dependent transcriptional regulator
MSRRIPKKELDWLAQVPLFSTCSQRELREIAKLGTAVMVDEGRVLTKQGAPGREFFLVLDGKAECAINGKRVAFFGPGDYFGELALIEGGTRTATVTAITPMELLVLSAAEFASLIRSSSSIAVKMLTALAARVRESQEAAYNL